MAGVTWTKTRTPGAYKRPLSRKSGENLYRVVYRDGTGRQVTRNFARLADAENFKKDVDRPEDVAAGRITLGAVYDKMVAGHERSESHAQTLARSAVRPLARHGHSSSTALASVLITR